MLEKGKIVNKTDSNPPNYLYKYQSFNDEYALKNFIEHQFYFSNPIKFNDPFDFNSNFIIIDRTEGNLKVAFDIIRKGMQDQLVNKFNADKFDNIFLTNRRPNRNFEDFLTNKGNEGIQNKSYGRMGVICFSECNENILMWSHYSQSHKGFCLEFDTRYVPFHPSYIPFEMTLIKVDYTESYPSLSLSEINKNEGYFHPIKPLAKTKWKDWSYEKEWRLLSWNGSCLYTYDLSSLSAIYLGYKILPDDELRIRTIIAGFPARKDGSERSIYKMQRSETEFKVIPKKLNSNRLDSL